MWLQGLGFQNLNFCFLPDLCYSYILWLLVHVVLNLSQRLVDNMDPLKATDWSAGDGQSLSNLYRHIVFTLLWDKRLQTMTESDRLNSIRFPGSKTLRWFILLQCLASFLLCSNCSVSFSCQCFMHTDRQMWQQDQELAQKSLGWEGCWRGIADTPMHKHVAVMRAMTAASFLYPCACGCCFYCWMSDHMHP